MINNVWTYAIFPVVPAILCSFLLWSLIRKKSEAHYIKLFSNLLLMNLIQAIAYVAFSTSLKVAEFFADVYLITAYFFFTHLLMTAFSLSGKEKLFNRIQIHWLYVFPCILTVLHLLGFIVDSYRVENNALLHNDGELSFIFDFYILSSCVVTVVTLRRNIKTCSEDRMMVSKNVIASHSFIPLVLAFFLIVVLSMTPYAIPVVIIGPGITIYTALTFFYISKKEVIDLSIGFPFFFARVKIAYRLLTTHKTKADLKVFHDEVKKQFIIEALSEKKGDIQDAADLLQFNHTTLRKKIKDYGL